MVTLILAWVGAAAASGFIGGRSDWISCKAIKGLRSALERPENHDLARGLTRALIDSLSSFLADLQRANPFPGISSSIAECAALVDLLEADEPSKSLSRLLAELQDHLSGFLAIIDSDDRMAQRREVESQIIDAVWEWLRGNVTENPSPLLRDSLAHGLSIPGKSIEPWSSYFRVHLGEAINSEDGRFRDILQTELLSAANVKIEENTVLAKDIISMLTMLTIAIEASRWETCLLERGILMDVEVEPASHHFGLGQIDTPARCSVKLGQGYSFSAVSRFDSPFVILIEEYAGRWFPMQLRVASSRTGSLLEWRLEERVMQIKNDMIRVPSATWFRESNSAQIGLHRFVLVATTKSFPKRFENLIAVRTVFNESDLAGLGTYLSDLPAGESILFYAEIDVRNLRE